MSNKISWDKKKQSIQYRGLFLKNVPRSGISSVSAVRYVVSDEKTKVFLVNSKNLYGGPFSHR